MFGCPETRSAAGGRLVAFAAGGGSLLAVAAVAQQEAPLRPPPDWYVAAVVDMTTAEQIARACSSLGMDVDTAQSHASDVMQRLEDEGFDTGRQDGGMAAAPEAFGALQTAFLERHGLHGAVTEDMVCAAGRAEIAEGTRIGGFLGEVTQ